MFSVPIYATWTNEWASVSGMCLSDSSDFHLRRGQQNILILRHVSFIFKLKWSLRSATKFSVHNMGVSCIITKYVCNVNVHLNVLDRYSTPLPKCQVSNMGTLCIWESPCNMNLNAYFAYPKRISHFFYSLFAPSLHMSRLTNTHWVVVSVSCKPCVLGIGPDRDWQSGLTKLPIMVSDRI